MIGWYSCLPDVRARTRCVWCSWAIFIFSPWSILGSTNLFKWFSYMRWRCQSIRPAFSSFITVLQWVVWFSSALFIFMTLFLTVIFFLSRSTCLSLPTLYEEVKYLSVHESTWLRLRPIKKSSKWLCLRSLPLSNSISCVSYTFAQFSAQHPFE